MKGEFKNLLATPELPPLGPGPRTGVEPVSALNKALEKIFSASRFHEQRQQLIRALVFLWHDHLDEAHTIAQDINNADGAFVHGIMHRREPDYSNAKYWFRRVQQHGAFPGIARRVSTMPDRTILNKLLPNNQWDPFAFIDCCQESSERRATGLEKSLQEIQRVEAETLMSWFVTNSHEDAVTTD